MRNTFGTNVTVTLFGESHGEMIGAVLDGMAPGLYVDEDYIRRRLSDRRPVPACGGTGRVEADAFRIVSGLFRGRTTGAPLTILIPNQAARSTDYPERMTVPRPGHGDYTAYVKYKGFADHRGGGAMSGRLTAALVAAGAVAELALAERHIRIDSRVTRIGGLPADQAGPLLAEARAAGDSLGGILETRVTGLPAGLGEPFFDTVEGLLAHALFSIPAVKGVEFGAGFALADMRGSEANDPFRYAEGRVLTDTNYCGGVLGGITDGMPLTFRVCIKPTPSIGLPQQSVDLERQENRPLTVQGRHDVCIALRCGPVIDCMTALVLLDLLRRA